MPVSLSMHAKSNLPCHKIRVMRRRQPAIRKATRIPCATAQSSPGRDIISFSLSPQVIPPLPHHTSRDHIAFDPKINVFRSIYKSLRDRSMLPDTADSIATPLWVDCLDDAVRSIVTRSPRGVETAGGDPPINASSDPLHDPTARLGDVLSRYQVDDVRRESFHMFYSHTRGGGRRLRVYLSSEVLVMLLSS